jgi:small-conductance mechanosensitive channel
VYSTIFPHVSVAFAILRWRQPVPSFLRGLNQEWLSDVQEFLHTGLPKLIFIALYAWALILLVNFITTRVIKVAERRDNLGSASGAQVRTLATVIRATGIVIVAFLAFLQIMENVLHFNLGPLLASAGVAGVAIGLAAQTIVKDVLNGILILIEDQYNVGDVVTLAGMTGTVESMTLRKTTVRGFDGTLYIIPNSQVTNVANQTRGFSVSTLNVSVDFSANPDQVIPLLKKIALGGAQRAGLQGYFPQRSTGVRRGFDQGHRGHLPHPDQDAGAQAIRGHARDAAAHPPGAGGAQPAAGQPLPRAQRPRPIDNGDA